MRARNRTWLAWLLFGATFGCLAGGLVVTLLVTRPLTAKVLVDGAFNAAMWLLFATVGLILMLRRPANPIGWLYAAAGLVWTVYIPWDPWVDKLLRGGRPLPPAAHLAALAGDFLWAVGLTLAVTLPLLLLPDGRLRSRRWRLVAAAAVSVVLRFRASSGVERQQLRWVAAGAALAVAGPTVLLPLEGLVFKVEPNAFAIPLLLSIPLAIAVAVLRYRLWDLDRLISRTVSYALLTALLAVPYLLILPAATSLAGGAGNLAVAAATLTAAAAFQPLRRRVQDLVDRRFDRRRYDAARTVEGFARRLRDQVDLDVLRGELLAVVDQTVQPTQVSLWLRAAPSPRPRYGR
jgi:hypothetical protein